MATDLLSADASLTTSPNAAHSEVVSPQARCASVGAGQGSVVLDSGGSAVAATNSVTAELQARRSARNLAALASDYVQLTKPRIVAMILITTTATAMIGAGGLVAAPQLFWLLIGTAAVAASAGAANQIWERVIDCRMTRTASRPLPAGRLSAIPAALFTAVLGVLGSILLYTMFGPVPCLVGVATWLLYVLAYTPMKTRTSWNTTVGAIAGALPVWIGYTAMGGSLAQWTPWLLLGVLVAWQYPHFMSIAWMYRRQYAAAGFCMTTTVEPTGRSASLQSIAGSVALLFCGVALCFMSDGLISAVIAAAVVCISVMPMLLASIRFAARPDDGLARKLLRSSLLVLPAVLATVTLRLFW